MKRLLAVFMLFSLSFSLLFASGSKEASETKTALLGEEPVTIVFWHCASDESGVFIDKFIDTFNK